MKKIIINKTNLVHVVLGHSYLFYFLALIVGILFDMVVGVRFSGQNDMLVGFILLILGTGIIYLAQNTSRKAHHRNKKESGYMRFMNGPYKFTRSPTHLGLGVTMVGLSFVLQSVSLFALALLAFLITRYIFIAKEEKILLENYGEDYLEYKKHVTF
jgi:protein-S-isoprenylcysteine O-methyltransferase Ste14